MCSEVKKREATLTETFALLDSTAYFNVTCTGICMYVSCMYMPLLKVSLPFYTFF